MPREGHGSRNELRYEKKYAILVMPREGHGSRNYYWYEGCPKKCVMPREGHGVEMLCVAVFVLMA